MGLNGWELHRAIVDDNLKGLKDWTVEKSLDPNSRFRGQTLLTTCVHENRQEILEFLLKLGANPDVKSDEGGRKETPLITAVRLKKASLVKLLISYRAQISVTNFYGQDAIYQAVVDNAYEILEYLLCSSSYPCWKLNESESGHHHQQVSLQCPLYLALTQSSIYPSKKRSLLHLLRFNYSCPCVLQLFSRTTCTRTTETTTTLTEQIERQQRSVDTDRVPGRVELGSGNGNPDDYHHNVGVGSNILSLSQEVIKVDPEIIHWIYLSLGYPVIKFHSRSHLSPLALAPVQPRQWQINDGTKTTHSSNKERRREVLSLSSETNSYLLSHSKADSFAFGFDIHSLTMSRDREALYPTKLIYLSRITIRKLSTISARRQQTSFPNIIKALPLPPPLINFLLLAEICP